MGDPPAHPTHPAQFWRLCWVCWVCRGGPYRAGAGYRPRIARTYPPSDAMRRGVTLGVGRYTGVSDYPRFSTAALHGMMKSQRPPCLGWRMHEWCMWYGAVSFLKWESARPQGREHRPKTRFRRVKTPHPQARQYARGTVCPPPSRGGAVACGNPTPPRSKASSGRIRDTSATFLGARAWVKVSYRRASSFIFPQVFFNLFEKMHIGTHALDHFIKTQSHVVRT